MNRLMGLSCIAIVTKSVFEDAYMIAHKGGIVEDDSDDGSGCAWNFWQNELDAAGWALDEVMYQAGPPKGMIGLVVWEGSAQPVYDDAAEFYGEWRAATLDDIINFGVIDLSR